MFVFLSSLVYLITFQIHIPPKVSLLCHLTPVSLLWISCSLATTFPSSPNFSSLKHPVIHFLPHTTIHGYHYSQVMKLVHLLDFRPTLHSILTTAPLSFVTINTLPFPTLIFQPHTVTCHLKLAHNMLEMLFCHQHCNLRIILA